MDSQIEKLIRQQSRATAIQLSQILEHIAAATFSKDLLDVDEPLWGTFWHGDVIAPGYRLPAIELALLRATRLDDTWPEDTTVPQFLADLRRAIQHRRAGVWALKVAGESCVVVAAPYGTQRFGRVYADILTVVWYCVATGQLHAGYRTPVGKLNLTGAIEQRGLELQPKNKTIMIEALSWMATTSVRYDLEQAPSLAARLDRAILGFRI